MIQLSCPGLSDAVGDPWAAPPLVPDLADGDVHVWRASLEFDVARDPLLAATLSDEERARASRFHHARDAARYVKGRGLLRDILACYLPEPPAALRFAAGPTGKPFLVGSDAVRFNLSHSAELALYAVARNREVGIDVEQVRDDVDHDALARRFFSPAERDQLRQLPESARREAFFACWAAKEAVLKATGEGLSAGLGRFDVVVLADRPAGRQVIRDGGGMDHPWSVTRLHPAEGYAAAVAVEDGGCRLSCWQWSGR